MPLDLPPADDAVARRSSIVFAITQIRFSENPAVSEPATGVRFHELLGGPEGPYPQINQARRALLNIGPGGQGTEHESSGWRVTAEGWLVGIFPGIATLQTTEAYEGWDDFAARFTQVLDAISEVVQPAIIERVGLRFTDRLTDLGVEFVSGWEAYVAPAFLGPVLVPGLGQAATSTEQRVVIDVGEGVTCNFQQAATEPTDGSSDYLIDCDFFWEGGRPFDAAVVQGQVTTFKEQADSVFAAATTATLIERIAQ